MNLRAIAEHFSSEEFEAFDEATQSFVPSTVVGRVSLVDRFQSIYNKPLRRRTLFHAPELEFPPSYTVRSMSTGDTYLLGQRRTDSLSTEDEYHGVTVMHLATYEPPGATAGPVEVHRRMPQGPESNPGWLVDEIVDRHYADFEFRTSSSEEGTYEFKTESYTVHMPRHAELERNDFLVLDGRWLRVEDQYPDSGFILCRVDEEPDSRVNLVLHHRGGRRYDPDLQRYVDGYQEHNFTGEVVSDYDMATWLSESTTYIDVVVEQKHIGVKPVEGDSVEYDGVKRQVKRVEQHAGRRQYRMRCE